MGKIPEACGLWIEQRVQEELEAKKESGASLREIGRTVADEVEKYFETKVNPGAIFSKAQRMAAADSKESPDTTARNNEGKGGVHGGGCKNSPKETPELVENKIKEGKSKKQARREVAEETGVNENSVRSAHQRAEKKKQTDPDPEANGQTALADPLSMRYAEMAIAQLEKIEKGAADSQKAFDVVTNWINKIDRKKSPWPQDCPDYFREFDRDQDGY